MSSIFQKAAQHFAANLPFVLFCKPNSQELKSFFQVNDLLHEVTDFETPGFVFTNFKADQSYLFPASACEMINELYAFEEVSTSTIHSEASNFDQAKFEGLVEKAVYSIREGVFDKVVLSRKETLVKEDFDFLVVFRKMLSKYQSAFRYCWFHPNVGMWMGATPEQLIHVNGREFKTVALAGTQKWRDDEVVVWQKKEREEQKFVTDYILARLEHEVEFITQSLPYTFKAGNLVHLKTDISGVFRQNTTAENSVFALHPTPAVCGLPTKASQNFIQKYEGYDRKFYSGFLGDIQVQKSGALLMDLCVNLRCMEIDENQVHIYVGCGITKDSNPEKEYFETANKAMTMKQILN